MKHFLTSSAIALLIGTSAIADEHSATFFDTPFDVAVNLNASELIGARVYATETDVGTMLAATTENVTGWDDIGEINEIILTRDGAAQAVIVGVGGFLGIGEKDVAITLSDLNFVSDGENPDDYFLVINSNSEWIVEAPTYQGTSAHMTPPEIEREGYKTTMAEDLTAEDLAEAKVYGPNDELIGEIDELLLTDDGKLDRAVLDVGGFLGLGERTVAVPFTELTIIRTDDGDDVRVYTDSSKEALEAQPEYED